LLCAVFALLAAPAAAEIDVLGAIAKQKATSAQGRELGAEARASRTARVFRMVRRDMRVSIRVRGGRVVRAHIRARERCGNGAAGFLTFDLYPEDAIPLRPNRSFRHAESFDDARGKGTVVLEGLVHRRTITGVFLFRNGRDRSCGTGRPGKRRVLYTARLRS